MKKTDLASPNVPPTIDANSLEILFEDRWLLLVNKPAGLPTQPSVDRRRPSLYSLLLESKKWPYLGLHHRLDVPTSGIVLLTKHKEANKGVSELFKGRNLQKTYSCLVQGVPGEDQFECQNYLKPLKLKTGKTKMVATLSGGDPAHTLFKVVERFQEQSLLEAQPLTGRMHQIRTHLAELKFPILGDSLYFRADRHYPRLMLHAARLSFPHPITGEPLTITAPWPDDFNRVLQKLRKTDS
jgi:RluA family pseudouridine synthase